MVKRELIEGQLQGNERGYAFLLPFDEGKEDYFIPHSDLRGAMHKDTVLCETTSGTGARTTARVLKILSRGIDELVGTYQSCKSGGFVIPDDKKYYSDIFIRQGKGLRAKFGDKVVCKILSYPKKQNPEGIISKILGRQLEKQAELKAIEYSFKLEDEFDKSVLEEANKVAVPVSKQDVKGRKDYRGKVCFTIDGEDAKDFDDAVSIELLKNGNYRLGVHIADVTHYVLPFGRIDKEAYTRATSVYFPEKVIPMLPEKLCNDVCSLKENVDRLTLTCEMVVDNQGRVVEHNICPSVIKSSARLTYNKVQSMLDGDREVIKNYPVQYESIKLMNELTDILIAKRDKNGSIDLDVKESFIKVDDNGNIDVSLTKRDKAHRIIEEFMILANVTVAEYAYFLECPFVYRIHEKPSQDKLDAFFRFLQGLGVKPGWRKGNAYPKDFQDVLKNSENTPYYTLINRVMLRSMQKAKYSNEDKGHFGLSATHYCHFTSPIRRYPDLVVHRVLKDVIAGCQDLEKRYANYVINASKQSSEKEKNATEAERAVDDFYKLLYINGFVGEEFDAIISGVTGFGVFAELDNAIEGLVKIENIKSRGRLEYNAEHYTLSDGKTTFRLGQKVKIKVVGVNLSERRAEFVLVD